MTLHEAIYEINTGLSRYVNYKEVIATLREAERLLKELSDFPFGDGGIKNSYEQELEQDISKLIGEDK